MWCVNLMLKVLLWNYARSLEQNNYEVGVLRAHLNRHFLSADTCIVQNFEHLVRAMVMP